MLRSALNVFVVCVLLAPASVHADPASDRSLKTANGLLERGLAAEAIAEYRAALGGLDDSGDIDQALYGLAVAQFRIGKYADSLVSLGNIQSATRFEFAADAQLLEAHALHRLKRYSKAAAGFESFVQDNPRHGARSRAAGLAVECAHRGGDHDMAIRLAEDYGPDLDGTDSGRRISFFAAISYSATHQYEEAAELFEHLADPGSGDVIAEQSAVRLAGSLESLGRKRAALEAYSRAMESKSDEVRLDATIGRAALLRVTGKPKAAGELLASCRKEAPGYRSARVALELGLVELNLVKPARAHAYFAEAEKDPALADDAAYWHAKADMLAGDSAAAVERFVRALRTFEDSDLRPKMLFDLAVAQERFGDADEARGGFVEFLKTFPKHRLVADALVAAASLALADGDFDSASTHAMEVLQRHPGSSRAADAAFVLGESAYRAGEFSTAVTVFERLSEMDGIDEDLDKRTRYRLGMSLAAAGRMADAEEHLLAATDGLNTDERFVLALAMLGDGAFENDEWEAAVGWYEKYLGAIDAHGSDDDQDAQLRLALSCARSGDHERAVGIFDAISEKPGDHTAHALFEAGQSLVAIGRIDEAADRFDKLLSDFEGSRFEAHALRHLGSIEMKRGNPEAAEAYFAGAIGLGGQGDEIEIERARALLDLGQAGAAAEALSPRRRGESSSRAAWRIIALARDGQDSQAVRQRSRLDESELSAQLGALVAFESARALLRLGLDAEAEVAMAGLADRADAGSVGLHARVELAGMYLDSDRYAEALELLSPLLDSDSLPDELCASVLYRASWAAYRLGDHARVEGLLEPKHRRCDLGTLTPAAEMLLGESLLSTGRARAAAERFGLIVASYPDSEQQPMAMLRLGDSFAGDHNWVQSRSAYENYLKEHGDEPDWFRARFGLGWAIENGGDPAGAIEHYREVTDKHEGETAARAQFQIGECLFALGRLEEAVRELLRVDILHAEPEWSAAALYEAGRCFEQMGKHGEARAQYRDVRARFGESDWAKAAGERLAALGRVSVPGRGGED